MTVQVWSVSLAFKYVFLNVFIYLGGGHGMCMKVRRLPVGIVPVLPPYVSRNWAQGVSFSPLVTWLNLESPRRSEMQISGCICVLLKRVVWGGDTSWPAGLSDRWTRMKVIPPSPSACHSLDGSALPQFPYYDGLASPPSKVTNFSLSSSQGIWWQGTGTIDNWCNTMVAPPGGIQLEGERVGFYIPDPKGQQWGTVRW